MKNSFGIFFVLMVSLFLARGQAYQAAVLANHPVSFWAINESSNSGQSVILKDYASNSNGMAGTNPELRFITGPAAPRYSGFSSTNTAIEIVQDNYSGMNLP